MIICAAIKLKMNNLAGTEHIVCGVRHGDCFKTIEQLNDNWKNATKIEGFVTHVGEFLDRGQAWEYVNLNGQLTQAARWFHEDNNWPAELVSEDLW